MKKYEKIEKQVEKIVDRASIYMQHINREYIHKEIWKAYVYARDAHEGQMRLSGDPYILHPVEATLILTNLKPDIYTIQTCLLHDVIEDTPKTQEDIEKDFGKEVAFLCEGLAKLSKVRYKGQERDIGSLRKMFIAMAEDVRVIFVKLSDRLHNMKTLKFHPKPEKREKIALETLNIYAPIADRLGLFAIKNALEEECFAILYPERYEELTLQLQEIQGKIRTFLSKAKEQISNLLVGKVENYEIDYRVKSIYSIHKKLLKKSLTRIDELFDIFGIRIMVQDESDCYKVLGIIHNHFTPLPQRFKDYIALPKPNGYRSLHTSVMGIFESDRKQPTEIQIKTYEMKEYADIGVAAHFEYKERGSKISKDIDWVNELKEIVDSLQDNDFVGSLKVDVFKDRIFVFTPKGDHINLPAGSTAIDFAYAIHTDLGDHITLAKVNNQVYPLDKELKNGNVVEIVIDKNKKPNLFRVGFVKTVKAKNRIKAFLKKENREAHIERGREIFSKYLAKFSMGKLDKDMTILKELDGKILNSEERLAILEQIGNFSVPAISIIRRLQRTLEPEKIEKKKLEKRIKEAIIVPKLQQKDKKYSSIIIGGEEGIDYVIAKCCEKKPCKSIVAHINNKGIIRIHDRNCEVLKTVNPDRLLPAYRDDGEEESLIYSISIMVENKIGVLKKIVDILYNMNLNIEHVETKSIGKSKKEISLQLKVLDYEYMVVDRFIDRIKMVLKDLLLDYSIGMVEGK